MSTSNITRGMTVSQEMIVTHKDTAAAHGSGKLEVFATPAMVCLMENTAIKCLKGALGDQEDSVGVAINVKHVKATAVGKKVGCRATVEEVEGRRVRFAVEAWDEEAGIGSGTHERAIINPEKFMAKIER